MPERAVRSAQCAVLGAQCAVLSAQCSGAQCAVLGARVLSAQCSVGLSCHPPPHVRSSRYSLRILRFAQDDDVPKRAQAWLLRTEH